MILIYFRFLYDDHENVSLVIKNVEMEDAGTYAIQATNELGTDSAHMQLNVKGKLSTTPEASNWFSQRARLFSNFLRK